MITFILNRHTTIPGDSKSGSIGAPLCTPQSAPLDKTLDPRDSLKDIVQKATPGLLVLELGNIE